MSIGRFAVTFACLLAAWILLTGSVDSQELIVGAISAAFVAGISYELFVRSPRDLVNPRRWAYLLAYLPAYIWAEVTAHLRVAYLILHPGLPIKPAIVRLKSGLKSDVGLTTLANSITMTPGTLTIDIDGEHSVLLIHWIDAKATDEKGVQEKVGEPLEKFIRGGMD